MGCKVTRRTYKIGSSTGVTLPKSWLDYHGKDKVDELTLIGNSILVIAPRGLEEKARQIVEGLERGEQNEAPVTLTTTLEPGEDTLVPDNMILPYPSPENVDSNNEDSLAVGAFLENLELIQEYVKPRKPDWEMVGVTMESIKKAGQRFFRVTKITDKTPVQENNAVPQLEGQ